MCEIFQGRNPFLLVIQAHWLNAQLCPMKHLFLTHFFFPLVSHYLSALVNFDFIWRI